MSDVLDLTPAQIKAAAVAAGRKYIVINGLDWVDALDDETGEILAAFFDMVELYETHRTSIVAQRTLRQIDGPVVEASVQAKSALTLAEVREAIDQLEALRNALETGQVPDVKVNTADWAFEINNGD